MEGEILTADELIEKSKDQRKRKRHEEALVSALAAADAESDNADAWWEVSLCRLAIGDERNAIPALKKTVELSPDADRAWSRLGLSLLNTGKEDEARKAFLEALSWDPKNIDALEAMSSIYAREDEQDQDDEEISVLERIEELSYLSSAQLNRFGILHYRKKRFHEAVRYWREDAYGAKDPASLFNLGLAYSQPQMSQDADAVDMWRLALKRFPGYEPSMKSLSGVLPKMIKLAADARLQGKTLLPREQWHEHYMNPFELLNPQDDLELEDFDPKTLQRLKKTLLHEIDLEDGLVSWMPGVTVDRSRGIGLCEELNDESKRAFHWHVYSNKPLLEFLTKGGHEHFLVGEHDSPLGTIELLEDEENGFREWLGDLFAPQFDRVLCKVIDAENLVLLECLLDGRRWVPASHADRCFENARRAIDRLIQPLRDANDSADDEKPSIEKLEELLNRGSVIGVLNLLPTYFEDFQNEAVQQLRGIAISSFNAHDDIELSRRVIDLAKRFRFRSEHVNRQIEEDVEQIENLIRQERQHEAKLARGSEKWEITKEGARLGDHFISAAEVSAVRWGSIVTRGQTGTTYDFLMSIGAPDGRRVTYAWKTTQEAERHQKHFQDLINAALNYLYPSLIERINDRLAKGSPVHIGPCKVTNDGVQFDIKGWFFTNTHTVPWRRVSITIENGDMIVRDSHSPRTKISFALRDTDNAPALRFLATIKNGQED